MVTDTDFVPKPKGVTTQAATRTPER